MMTRVARRAKRRASFEKEEEACRQVVSRAKKVRAVVKHHYSGDASYAFWQHVNAISDSKRRDHLYSLGCRLQNLEEQVLRKLAAAESDQPA